LGGFLIGLLQSLTGWFFGNVINLSSGSASYANIAVYVVLAIVLLANPNGLAAFKTSFGLKKPNPPPVAAVSND